MYKEVSVFSALMLFLMSTCNGERVVCGFSGSATGRSGEYAFEIADIPTSLCTHVLGDPMEIDMFTSELLFGMGPFEEVENRWKQLLELKRTKPDLKLLASVRSPIILQVAAENKSRRTLIESILRHMEWLQVDGVELFWGGIGPDDAMYTLLEELKSSLIAAGHPAWEVIVFVEIDHGTIDHGRLCRLADYVHVLGMGERKPKYSDNSSTPVVKATFDVDELKNITLERALQYWIDKSCPANKLVLGLVFGAQPFTLSADTVQTDDAPEEQATFCSFTMETMCSYVTLCQKFNESAWTMGWDDTEGLAPHAFQGDRWVAYENEASLGRKSEMAKGKNLAGVYAIAVDLDDYRNKCGTLYPLTVALSKSYKSA
uniref:GH18 domain-containing protein n=1 Tax=Anopheles culicifacies TaxID=139723 RepID=A0A182MBP6_9DIPT